MPEAYVPVADDFLRALAERSYTAILVSVDIVGFALIGVELQDFYIGLVTPPMEPVVDIPQLEFSASLDPNEEGGDCVFGLELEVVELGRDAVDRSDTHNSDGRASSPVDFEPGVCWTEPEAEEGSRFTGNYTPEPPAILFTKQERVIIAPVVGAPVAVEPELLNCAGDVNKLPVPFRPSKSGAEK